MIKLQGLSREQVREIASQTADAFYDYRYHDGDTGLIKYIPSREAMFIYIQGERQDPFHVEFPPFLYFFSSSI